MAWSMMLCEAYSLEGLEAEQGTREEVFGATPELYYMCTQSPINGNASIHPHYSPFMKIERSRRPLTDINFKSLSLRTRLYA
jgi:hypothetical protein